MALTEKKIIDRIEVLPESGNIQVREANIIYKDGVEIDRIFNRRVIEVDDETVQSDAQLEGIKGLAQTSELKAAKKARIKAEKETKPEDEE